MTIDDQIEQTIPWLGMDNTAGAYTAVRHLIKLGHRRIAHIQGPPKYPASHDRYNGYRQALLEEGIIPGPDLVLVGDFLPPTGRACAIKCARYAPMCHRSLISISPTYTQQRLSLRQ